MGLLLLLSPIFLVLAILIRLDSPGPTFHRGLRVGKAGEPFHIYKFRSMVRNAEKLGPGITKDNDLRVTRIGRWLRARKLDELPQLINVAKGDMRFVGARPEDPRYVESLDARLKRILDFKPGITSPASLTFRDEEAILTGEDWEVRYRREILPAKVQMDLEYLTKRSILRDLRVIVFTIARLLRSA